MEREAPPPPPSSPASGCSISVEDCLQEIMRFTLHLSSQSKLQTGLSTHYSAKLLIDQHDHQNSTNNEVSGIGVPSYPLYKRLASSIYQSVITHSGTGSIHKFNQLGISNNNWDELIVNKGIALINMLKDVDFELHVQEPFFTQLYEGVKTVEGRCAVGDYKRLKPGDFLLFNKCLILQVQDVHQYASFHEMLEGESLARVLPGVTTIEEGVQIYRKFYSEEKESSNGVIGICVKPPTSQLYSIMASLLSGLSCGGIQYILGFVNTAATNQDLLPPATSTLLETFMAPHNPHIKGSTLTDGARALAKHVDRSSERFWGSLYGNDSEKNKHALHVISQLLTQCIWLNIHTIPPHTAVLEIRTADGYGARWSADGTKFIGFLEPYTVEGYSRGWKH